jgi:hypothetical protein
MDSKFGHLSAKELRNVKENAERQSRHSDVIKRDNAKVLLIEIAAELGARSKPRTTSNLEDPWKSDGDFHELNVDGKVRATIKKVANHSMNEKSVYRTEIAGSFYKMFEKISVAREEIFQKVMKDKK